MKSTGVVLIVAMLTVGAAAQSDGNPLQASLSKALVGKQMTARFPYSGKTVVLSAEGCESDCERGSWVGDATYIIRKVEVLADEFTMTCDRLVVYHDAGDQPRAVVSPYPIRFRIKLNGEASGQTIAEALHRLFRDAGEPLPNGPPPNLEHATGAFEIRRTGSTTLVRERSGSEWKPSRQVDAPIEIGHLPDGQKVYTASKALEPVHPVSTPDPVFPAKDRRDHHQGKVTLRAVVDHTGRVQSMKVMRAESAAMVQASVMAVSRWRFNPAMLNGQPVACEIEVEINFRVR